MVLERKINFRIKETMPIYSFSAWNLFVRENFLHNPFRLKILQMIYLSNGIYLLFLNKKWKNIKNL